MKVGRTTLFNMSFPSGPSTPAAAITAIDEKITTVDTPSPAPLPYWLVNVPPEQWTAECPDFLRDLPEKNVKILSTPDEHYKRQGWEEVQEIISSWSLSLSGLVACERSTVC